MESVPPSILFKIFECLPTTSLANLSIVSRLWRAIAANVLYTNIEHHTWKPKRVSICLNTLSDNNGGDISTIVRHLDPRLWSNDPEFSILLLDALTQTQRVTKLKLSMSETFSHHFETHLLQRGIIASDSVGEGQPELWSRQFLPFLEALELSHGHRAFQLAASRPVRSVSSLTHMDYHALHHLLPFLQRSRGPMQSVHFHLTGRDTNVASKALGLTARKLPRLTHVFFNFFVSKRAHPPVRLLCLLFFPVSSPLHPRNTRRTCLKIFLRSPICTPSSSSSRGTHAPQIRTCTLTLPHYTL